MKIGWCAPLDDAARLRDLGYDFNSLSVECGSSIPEDGKRNTLAFVRLATAPLTCLTGDRT
jgi:hypothetical protein